jgi:saccharopine dehydrogenase-like NADP-dependent oxidoreductase
VQSYLYPPPETPSFAMANNSKEPKPVVFIGASDVICGKVIEYFAAASKARIVLADADEVAIRQATPNLPAERATFRKVKTFEPSELQKIVAGAGLVVLGAQPYYKTSRLVLAACLDAKIPYLDYSDDVASTQESLELFERAKQQDVPCYINCGASPGMTNLMAVDAAKDLDTVEGIDAGWCVTDEGGENGKEVLEHLMHIAAGPCLTWADGKATIHENWVETSYAPIVPGHPNILLHETVHPEPVTLPRAFPMAKRIRCIGTINPAPFNGFAQGLATAVRTGALTMDEATGFLWTLAKKSTKKSTPNGWGPALGAFTRRLRGGDITFKELYQLASHIAGSLRPWHHALRGMIDQIRSGESSTLQVIYAS